MRSPVNSNQSRAAIDELYALIASRTGQGSSNGAFRSVKSFGPTGTSDDSSTFQKAIAELAGTGISLWIPGGTYTFANPAGAPLGESMPSNIVLWMSPSTRLVSTMSFSGTQKHSIFYAQSTGNGNVGTLHTTPTLGSASVSVTLPAAPTVGNYLAISQSISQQTFKIEAVSGTDPYTITLDRPVLLPFTTGSAVVSELTSVPTNILFYGNGAACSGTGDRIIELVTAFDCHGSDIHYDTKAGALGDIAFSMDVGGFRSGWVRMTADGYGASGDLAGEALEACEQGYMLHCGGKNLPYAATLILDCIEPLCAGGWSRKCNYGVGWGTDSSLGTYGGTLLEHASDGDTFGLVLNGSTNSRVVGCTFDYAATNGIVFNANAAIFGTQFEGNSCDGCATGWSDASGGNTGTEVRGHTFNACTVACLSTESDLNMSDFSATGLTATMTAFSFASGNIVRLRNGTIVHSGILNALGFVGVARAEVDGMRMTSGSASSEGLEVADGVVVARNVVLTGPWSAGAAVSSGATFRQLDACAFDVATTPVTVAGGGFYNRGTVALNGTTPVPIAFTDAKKTDQLILSLKTLGGSGSGLAASWTVTSGTGFDAIGSVAGDTSTLNYLIL